jgi:hypothetical protein
MVISNFQVLSKKETAKTLRSDRFSYAPVVTLAITPS